MYAALLLLLVSGAEGATAPLVYTDYGPLQGHVMHSLSGREIFAFNGVPYAQPPLGSLRFKEAVAPEKHEEVLNVTENAEDCVQLDHILNKYPPDASQTREFVGSEDCLYLNIYTPNLKPVKPLPVMVFVHGGGFNIGSGSSVLHGPQVLLDKDILLVVINYRLGVFGFLSTDDDILPGNLGLKDQVAALRWIKQNIVNFGGDPDSITLFGESAGAGSVHLHMFSPLSRGLFHKVIAQSGTGNNLWAVKEESVQRNGREFIRIVGCEHSENVLKCLQGKTVEEIKRGIYKSKNLSLILKHSPVFEKKAVRAFVTKESFKEGSTLPLMVGVTSGEGVFLIAEMVSAGDKHLIDVQKNYESFLPNMLHFESHPEKEFIARKIKQNYVGDENFGWDNLHQTIQMMSDGLINYGVYKTCKEHKGPAYLYQFSHEGERSFTHMFQLANSNYGASHLDDLLYLFHMEKFFPQLEFTEDDAKVKKIMVDLWTHFATHGKPTGGITKDWKESEKGQIYIDISKDGLQEGRDLFVDSKIKFWEILDSNARIIKEEL